MPNKVFFWERYVGNGGYGGRGKLHFVNRDAVDDSVPTIADSKMTILEDGNVGIGTASPSRLLEVTTSNNSSDGKFSCWSTTDAHSGTIIFQKSANGTIGTYAATADGERLGTIAVYGSTSGNTLSQTTASIYFKQDGAATAARVPSRIEFWTSPPSNNQEQRMVIRADGNVGIGTTAASELLHAYKTANAAVAIAVQNPNTGNDARARIQLMSDGGTATLTTYSAAFTTSNQNIADSALLRASSLSGGLGLSADGATPLHFWTNDIERMRILGNGKVGIGTTAPNAPLHIYSADTGVGLLRIHNSSSSTGAVNGIDFYAYVDESIVTNPQAYIRTEVMSVWGSKMHFGVSPNGAATTAATTKMTLDDTGNVGIGDNLVDPQHRLHVSGDAIISGVLYDSTNSTGDKGYVLTSDDTGPLWAASGDFDGLSGNLIATGQTLQTQITSNDTDIAANTANLITTGQTLQTQITANDGDISTLTSNLITTGQTLQTQITSNDTDIATNATNIATNVTNISTNASNLITTGQYLTDEINTVSGLIPATVIDGGGTANKVPLWSDANTIGDSVIAQSGSAIGIGTTAPTQFLDILATQESDAGIRVTLNCNLDSQAPQLVLNRAAQNGGIVDSGDVLGVIKFGGYDGNSVENSAKIEATVNGTPSNDNMPTDLSFYTASAGSPVHAMTINKDQQVGIGTVSPDNILDIRSSGTPTLAVRNTGTSTNATLHLGEVNQTAYGVELRYEGNLGNLFLDNRYNHATRPHMYFRMRVAGTPITAMTIDPAGNVGIGSTTPNNILNIYKASGSTYQRIDVGNASNVGHIMGNSNALWYAYVVGGGNYQIWENSGANFNITPAGYVGIGVASMKTWYTGITQLALGSDRGTVVANASYIGVMENAYLNASAAWKKVAAGGASNVWQDDGTIYFRTTATGGSADDAITWNICAMDSSGEFGIGTSSPAQKLHVVGDAVKFERTNNAVALQLYNTNASPADDAALGYLQFTGKDNDGTANIVHSEVRGGVQSNSNTAVNGYLAFLTTNNGTAVTEWMRIKADGKIGIGTDAPTNKFTVYGGSQYSLGYLDKTADIHIANTSGGGVGTYAGAISFASTGEPLLQGASIAAIQTGSDANEIGLAFYTQASIYGSTDLAEAVRIKNDGNVGIGTTDPQKTFDVNGTSYFRNDTFHVDGAKAVFGGGDDLQIYHDGSHSYIEDTGTGYLRIKASDYLQLMSGAGEVFINCEANGAVYLSYDNSTKLATTSTGVAVTGGVVATSFSGNGASVTNLNALNITAGTVATARLGTGTADSSTFLRGDNTWVANANGTVTSVTAGVGLTISAGSSTVNPTLATKLG